MTVIYKKKVQSLAKRLEALEIREAIKIIKAPAFLKSTRLLRRVLEY